MGKLDFANVGGNLLNDGGKLLLPGEELLDAGGDLLHVRRKFVEAGRAMTCFPVRGGGVPVKQAVVVLKVAFNAGEQRGKTGNFGRNGSWKIEHGSQGFDGGTAAKIRLEPTAQRIGVLLSGGKSVGRKGPEIERLTADPENGIDSATAGPMDEALRRFGGFLVGERQRGNFLGKRS